MTKRLLTGVPLVALCLSLSACATTSPECHVPQVLTQQIPLPPPPKTGDDLVEYARACRILLESANADRAAIK